MKVVICDYDFKDISPEKEVFSSLPQVELVPRQCKTEEEVISLTKDADGVINQWSKLNANVIKSLN